MNESCAAAYTKPNVHCRLTVAAISLKGWSLESDLPCRESSTPWFKVLRSDETRELLSYPCAFALLALIAYRAQRTSAFNRHGLAPGQSFIGDYKACGLSEQQYRTAKGKLEEWKFATFKATNKGTVANLTDTRVFDINAEPINEQINTPTTDNQRTVNGQATGQQQASNGQVTTTNKYKNGNKAKNEKMESLAAPAIPPKDQHLPECEAPSWQEWWDYCRSMNCGLTAEWYAKDKFQAAQQTNWKGKENWRAYASRCKGWWEQDGRPMTPPARRGQQQPQSKPMTERERIAATL